MDEDNLMQLVNGVLEDIIISSKKNDYNASTGNVNKDKSKLTDNTLQTVILNAASSTSDEMVKITIN